MRNCIFESWKQRREVRDNWKRNQKIRWRWYGTVAIPAPAARAMRPINYQWAARANSRADRGQVPLQFISSLIDSGDLISQTNKHVQSSANCSVKVFQSWSFITEPRNRRGERTTWTNKAGSLPRTGGTFLETWSWMMFDSMMIGVMSLLIILSNKGLKLNTIGPKQAKLELVK